MFTKMKWWWLRRGVRRRLKERALPTTNPIEQKASNIFLELIKKAETRLIPAPISSRLIAENSNLEMVILLDWKRLIIINTVFQYDIPLPDALEASLKAAFNRELERRAQRESIRFLTKVKQSLDTIQSKIQKPDR